MAGINKLLAMLRQTVVIIIILTNQLLAQQDRQKSFALGLQTTGTSSMTPNIAFGLSLNYQYDRHQLNGAFDIYSISFYNKSVNIPGYQLGYSFFLRKPDKSFNTFINFNMLYVQYATGAIWPVRYNYLPTDEYTKSVNSWQIKSFANTLGIGINFKVFKIIRPFLIIGGGYNYFIRKNSPTNDTGYKGYETTATVPSIYIKLGLTVDLYADKKHSQ